jgi:hypothetical protein
MESTSVEEILRRTHPYPSVGGDLMESTSVEGILRRTHPYPSVGGDFINSTSFGYKKEQ